MNRRIATIENRKVLADSGEVTINLGVRDPITALMIEFRATNGATSNIDNPLAECVSTVELIDGGNTIFSLTGMQFAALTAYNRGYIPYWLVSEIPSNVQNLFGEVQFGRWHGDTVYAFDPSRFSNPQIRVKWNLATNTAVGATGYVSGTMTLTIRADLMVGAANPQGFITAKQHYSFTTAASGTEYIDLPVDRRLKGLMLQSLSDTGGGLYGLSNIKLSCDQDKFIPFYLSKVDFQRALSLKNPEFHYKHGFYASNTDTIYPVLKQDEVLSLTPDTGDMVAAYLNTGIGSGAITLYNAGSAYTTDKTLWGEVCGWSPFHTGYMDMGEYDDPASWLDVSSFRSARLELTENAASATASAVLIQEVVY